MSEDEEVLHGYIVMHLLRVAQESLYQLEGVNNGLQNRRKAAMFVGMSHFVVEGTEARTVNVHDSPHLDAFLSLTLLRRTLGFVFLLFISYIDVLFHQTRKKVQNLLVSMTRSDNKVCRMLSYRKLI